MRNIKRLVLTFILLFTNTIQIIDNSYATNVLSSNADATGSCTQAFSDVSYVTVNRYTSECVILIKTSDNVTSYSTTWTVPTNLSQIRTLIVGGGGGGSSDVAGGGGGGQVRLDTLTVTPNSNISINVGKGGAPGTGTSPSTAGGAVGETSSVTISGFATSAIGGSGGVNRYGTSTTSGYTGGGGSYSGQSGTTGVGGAAYKGGNAWTGQSSGGGGGAGGAGGDATSTKGGDGGQGVTTDLSGASICYGGGGGGSAYPTTGQTVGSGVCGGSNGTLGASASAATQNTGGGGGGQGTNASGTGGQGGSGIIVIRFSIANTISSTTILSASNTNKLTNTTITATLTPNTGGTITFYANGRKINKCVGLNVISGTSTCIWKPITHGITVLTATFTPSDVVYKVSNSSQVSYLVSKRTASR